MARTFATFLRLGDTVADVVTVRRTDSGIFHLTTLVGGNVADPFGGKYVTLASVETLQRDLIAKGLLVKGDLDQIPMSRIPARITRKARSFPVMVAHMATVSDKGGYGYADKAERVAEAIRMIAQMASNHRAVISEQDTVAMTAELAR